jgi:hypothetical protein
MRLPERTPQLSCLFSLACLFFCGTAQILANDTEVSIAAGGIQMVKDPRISMEKERLNIGKGKVVVEYEFLNETASDITTEMAFPVKHFCFEGECGPPAFADFRVWIDGVEVKYAVKAFATVNNHDYSSVLQSMDIDIASYGHWYFMRDNNGPNYDVTKLSENNRSKLIELGLIDKADYAPKWDVQEIYHWNQRFPSKKIIRIRHEYRPAVGYQAYRQPELSQAHPDLCIDPGLDKKLVADNQTFRANRKFGPGNQSIDDYVQAYWVDYILTTANNWKTPIKDFTLILERPEREGSPYPWYVSFCWDGAVKQTDKGHYIAQKKDFIPTKELRIYFLTLMNQ